MDDIPFAEAQPIDGYGPGFFRIMDRLFHHPLLLSPWSLRGWGGFDDIAIPLTLAGRIDVLFLGTGADIAHAPRPFRSALEDAGIGVEVMSSPAACRTYNLLLTEGRLVAVALLPVEG